MRTYKLLRSLKVLAATATLLVASGGQASAATGSGNANVNQVLITGDSTFGGCMALLSPGPETLLSSCKSAWVSFSCTGDFTDTVRAYRMFDAAELALATGNGVYVYVQDDKTHNGYCYANRIQVKK